MAQRYYMVIINALQLRDENLAAREIAKVLFGHNKWLFSPTTAKVRSLQAGDRLVVYAAGKGNRCFLGDFTLVTEPSLLQNVPQELVSLARLYSLGCDIKDKALWAEPKPIVDMLPRLSFVKDKRNYGLYLRQGLRELSEEDYNVITG